MIRGWNAQTGESDEIERQISKFIMKQILRIENLTIKFGSPFVDSSKWCLVISRERDDACRWVV